MLHKDEFSLFRVIYSSINVRQKPTFICHFPTALKRMILVSNHILISHPEPATTKYIHSVESSKLLNTSSLPQKTASSHSLALVLSLAHFLVEVHLNLEDELQLFVGAERCEGAVDLLARFHRLPVVLTPQVDFVTASCFFVMVPATRTLLCVWRKNSIQNLQ